MNISHYFTRLGLNYNYFCCIVLSAELEVKMKHKPFSMPSNIIPTEIFNSHAGTHLLCHIYCDWMELGVEFQII